VYDHLQFFVLTTHYAVASSLAEDWEKLSRVHHRRSWEINRKKYGIFIFALGGIKERISKIELLYLTTSK